MNAPSSKHLAWLETVVDAHFKTGKRFEEQFFAVFSYNYIDMIQEQPMKLK